MFNKDEAEILKKWGVTAILDCDTPESEQLFFNAIDNLPSFNIKQLKTLERWAEWHKENWGIAVDDIALYSKICLLIAHLKLEKYKQLEELTSEI